MKNLRILFLTLFAVVLISSCKKDVAETPSVTPTAPVTSGTVSVNFTNMVGDSLLTLNTKSYINANNDTFRVSEFKYYISNIKLTKSDGSIYTEAESYHLVDASIPGTCKITLSKIPFGKYTAISFIIGVDSIRNISGAQTGALDPANNMFWNWSSGYIMAKMIGISPQSTNGKLLEFDIIGFRGPYNVLKPVSPSFNSDTVRVSSNISSNIDLKTDLSEWFKTPNTISFSNLNTVNTIGPDSRMIADNYADMISVNSIQFIQVTE
ncbi:MAG: hypothetical protein H0W84_00810 [Bacteroidetes bacterium]|nr:hypothetical protein [Bacteroidota bacterium]